MLSHEVAMSACGRPAMSMELNPFRLRRRDVAKVVALGLAQVATLVVFLLVTILVV